MISIPVIIAYLNRIRIEEKILTDQFGVDYIDYIKNISIDTMELLINSLTI
jgi:protein-S-isoprenylcysteine O-methyltransferase Ste14